MASAALQRWLRVDGSGKPEVYASLFEAAALNQLPYWLEIVFAAGIATLGLVSNSPAVIIGAMLISPLMSPILSAGLALAIGDLYLGIRAVASLTVSIGVSIGLAAATVWLLPFHSPTNEILSRTNPNLLDLGIAILSGLAAALVISRGRTSGGVTALPGVAIAVALMPPLCTVGFGLGSGVNTVIMSGAALLFLTNLVAIVASAFLVFLLVGMDGDDVRAEIDRSRERHAAADPVYRLIRGTAFARTLTAGGSLFWRVLMLGVLLAAIFVPLRNALEQVKDDVVARTAVQDALRDLAPANSLVSRQVSIGPRNIRIALISTQHIGKAQIERVQRALLDRTGRTAEVRVEEVASKSELKDALDRLAMPTRELPAPRPPELDEVARELRQRVGRAVEAMWPVEMPLIGYEVAATSAGQVVRIRYESKRELPPEAAAVFESVLRNTLASPALALELIRDTPGTPRRGSK